MYDPRIRLDRLEIKEPDVKRYEQQPVEEGMILFYGSSCFTRWSAPRYGFRPLEEVIRGKNGEKVIVNHGIGTSTVEELLYYYPRLVRPWKPRALVVTTFLNDCYYGYGVGEIMFLLKRLLAYARTDMPGIRIFLADVHPTVQHIGETEGYFVRYRAAINEELRKYCREHDDCTFLCHTASPVFYADPKDAGDYNKIRTDLFVADGVHFTQEGYDRYAEFYREALKDIL